MHVLRCLTEDIAFAAFEQNFFNRCCFAVVEKSTDYCSDAKTADEELNKTTNLFKAQRLELELRTALPQGVLETPYQPPRAGMTFLLCNLARDMLTNSRNHLVLNFGKRVARYLRYKHNLNKGQAWKFIKKAFSEDADRTEDQIAFADWLGMPPYENVIRDNFHHAKFVADMNYI